MSQGTMEAWTSSSSFFSLSLRKPSFTSTQTKSYLLQRKRLRAPRKMPIIPRKTLSGFQETLPGTKGILHVTQKSFWHIGNTPLIHIKGSQAFRIGSMAPKKCSKARHRYPIIIFVTECCIFLLLFFSWYEDGLILWDRPHPARLASLSLNYS